MTTFDIDSIDTRANRRRDLLPGRSDDRFLPEPLPRERHFTIISVDDHVVEPPGMFEGRLAAKYIDAAPKVVTTTEDTQEWHFDDQVYTSIGLGAVIGRPYETYDIDPTRFDQMRPGCSDPAARVADMNLAGIAMSLNFPNMLPGFAGQRFARARDPELGLALIRAWNDWMLEDWCDAYPGRFIACQLPWLGDPVVAAAEVRANAGRGFRAVSFPEAPHKLGYPSLHSDHWYPLFQACEETETVICLHVGSASHVHTTAEDAPPEVVPVLFGVTSLFATVDWLYSGIPLLFPNIKVVLSEGGVGWVPALMDRIEHNAKHRPYYHYERNQDGLTALEVLHRNFWFCALDDSAGIAMRHRVGVNRILVECDYPHADSTWPDIQELLARQLQGVPPDEVARMTHLNAAALFRVEVPSLG